MTTKSVLVDDPRFPGGSKEEIKNDYGLDVTIYDDGTFEVSGPAEDVDAYLEDYAIVPVDGGE